MLERQYRMDPWLTLAAMLIPAVASLPFLHASPWTLADAELVLSVKTLGLMRAPGYPVYLLFTHALAQLLPLASWAARVQLLHVLYLSVLTGLIFRLGRTLLFPPLACFSASLSTVLTTWIWPEVLLPAPLVFHLCLLLVFLWLTLSRLMSPAGRHLYLVLFAWGTLGGLLGGQESFLWAWVVPALALGTWLSPGRRAWPPTAWVVLGVGVAAGALLPYGYLLARLFSAHAFINTDLVPQLAAWRDAPSLDLLENWLVRYFHEPRFWLPSAAPGIHGVWPVLSSLPFLTLCCWLLGTVIHLRQLLFQPVHAPASEPARFGRLVAGGLPLLALAATALFASHQPGALPLAWIISGTLWGFSGFNYLYAELGRPANQVVKPSTSPAPFGVLVLALVPLFTWVQTYPRVQFLSHQIQSPSAPLAQARAWLQGLPPRALLVFPNHAQGDSLAYLQAAEGLRPDVQLQAFSAAWPAKPYTGRTVLELLGTTPEARLHRRLNFAEYWNQQLRAELAAGLPAYLLTPPLAPDPVMDEVLRIFDLAWERNLETRVSHERPVLQPALIFSLRPRALPAAADRPPGRAQGAFDRCLRLVRSETLPSGGGTRRSFLACHLLWEPWPGRKLQNYFLEFQLVAAPPARPGSETAAAAERWTLGQRPLIQADLAPGELPDCFWETYQFFFPPGLPPGHYCLYASLWDASAREWLPAKAPDSSGYGLLVGEFSAEAERP